jgi:hypothetical protein
MKMLHDIILSTRRKYPRLNMLLLRLHTSSTSTRLLMAMRRHLNLNRQHSILRQRLLLPKQSMETKEKQRSLYLQVFPHPIRRLHQIFRGPLHQNTMTITATRKRVELAHHRLFLLQ